MKCLISLALVLAASGCAAACGAAGPTGSAPAAATAPAPAARPALATALTTLRRRDGDHFAVAVADLATGQQASYGSSRRFVTASVVKVDILAVLLYQAQQAGHGFTADQQALATTMIENSNNDAASDLYAEAGGAPGISQVNRVFGLTRTTIGTDGVWGLTTTTVSDQIRLLRQVFTPGLLLTDSSRAYIQSLMSHVEPDQSFGVSAGASTGTQVMLKDGYLPNPTLWAVNSIGEIVRDGQHLLVAVLSDDNASLQSGSSVVAASTLCVTRESYAATVGLGILRMA